MKAEASVYPVTPKIDSMIPETLETATFSLG
mgnify:CR=1 FL=1